MKIGFIGLGNVGGKLAESLFRNQFDLIVHDLDNTVADSFKSRGIKIAKSVGDLTREVDVIITCLPSTKASEDDMISENGNLKMLKRAGFEDIETIWKWGPFQGFLAIK